MGTTHVTDPASGMVKVVPTHQVFFGDDSRQSLAFATALDSGVPLSIVQRAEQYYTALSAEDLRRPGPRSIIPPPHAPRVSSSDNSDGMGTDTERSRHTAHGEGPASHTQLQAKLAEAVDELVAQVRHHKW